MSFPTTAAGYAALLSWARDHGQLRRAGVEGTSSHGTALNRHLRRNNVQVIEVNRPDRATRRRRGKTDMVDARTPPGPYCPDAPPPSPSPRTVTAQSR
jgi:hypothetical protein